MTRGSAVVAGLLAFNTVALWLGLTRDAVTISKTMTREVLGLRVRLIDERATYSIVSGIFELRDQGEWFLFLLLFSFSVVFPILKLAASWGLFAALVGNRGVDNAPRWAAWLQHLGKWSMLDVFALALLAVLIKLGGLTRVRAEVGIFWFSSAVVSGILVATQISRLARRMGAAR